MKGISIKINSKLIFRLKSGLSSSIKNLDEKWQTYLLPLIEDLASEMKILYPIEYYHSIVKELHMQDHREELLERVKNQMKSYIEEKFNTVFSESQKLSIEETGDQLLIQAHKIRTFMRQISVYFYSLTPFQSQNTDHMLYEFGRSYLIKLIEKDDTVKNKRNELGSKLFKYLNIYKEKLIANEENKNWQHYRRIFKQTMKFLEMIYDKIPNFVVIQRLLKDSEKAKSDKMKNLCYYYLVLFFQHTLIAENPKDHLNDEACAKLYPNENKGEFIANFVLILNSTLLDLFINNCIDEIGVLYNCCKESGLSNTLLDQWKQILESKGKEQIDFILKEEKTHIVENLMEFKKKSDIIVESAFHNNSEFRMGQKKSFEAFLNIEANKIAEYMAKYLDLHLGKNNKTKIVHNDEEMETIIQDTMTIFKFIHAKDVFQAFYLKGLSKRLLHKKSLSNDAEKYVFIVLKRECGDEFTQKIENMIKDMSNSDIIMEEYHRYSKIQNSENEIKVLTQGSWPVQSRVQVKIPESLNKSLTHFAEYYKMKHQGKILKWNPYLSFCDVEASYDVTKQKKRTLILEVNLMQTAVLMLFNYKNEYSFEEILSELDIEEESLESVLVSLCSMKYKILKKSNTTSRNIKHDESFNVDENFKPKLKKISITAVSKKQSQLESEETHVRVLEDRKYLLEALIVQQMKKHNKMEHTALVNEIFSKVKFPLTHNVIKDRIESLISRDYMEISEDNPNLYLYIA